MAFKLGGERRAARYLAATMVGAIGSQPDLIVAVPATRRALSERGFNTALELAKPLGRHIGAPVRMPLRKVRDTADQAGLGREARMRNLAIAFACAPVDGLVLLVDDVLTTGATADACAKALREAGADRVDVITFGRAGGGT